MHWNEPKDHSKCVVVSELLQAAGYQTMMVGKWQGRDSALDRGFDHFYGPMCQSKISYFHEVEGNKYYLDRERIDLPADWYLTDALNDHALKFLKDAIGKEDPFFLYVAHIAPHWPLHAREEEFAPFRQRYLENGWDQIRASRFAKQKWLGLIDNDWKLAPRSPGVKDWTEDKYKVWQAERMAVYAAQIAAIDRGLGQLLQAVEEAGEADNTMVIFLSDNGAAPDGGVTPSSGGFGFSAKTPKVDWRRDGHPIKPGSGPNNMPGPHDTFAGYGIAWANASNTPLRGTKLEGYEGGVRTPLVVRWPRVVKAKGGMTNQPGHVMDFMPTLLELAKADYPEEYNGRHPLPLEGNSLLPILRGETRQGPAELCWSVPRHQAIMRGDWKAVRPQKGGDWQLFNLKADGTETTDLAKQEPDRVKELAGYFAKWRERVGMD